MPEEEQEPNFEKLIEKLKKGNTRGIRRTIKTMSKQGKERVVRILVGYLNNEEWIHETDTEAMNTRLHPDFNEKTRMLAQFLQVNITVKKTIIEALGEIGDSKLTKYY